VIFVIFSHLKMIVLPRQARDKHRAKLLINTLTQAAGGGKERSMKWTQVRRKKETPHLSSSLSLWMKCDDDLTRQARDTRRQAAQKRATAFVPLRCNRAATSASARSRTTPTTAHITTTRLPTTLAAAAPPTHPAGRSSRRCRSTVRLLLFIPGAFRSAFDLFLEILFLELCRYRLPADDAVRKTVFLSHSY
jgi:hypothetical protein